jgi:hypothetical protein
MRSLAVALVVLAACGGQRAPGMTMPPLDSTSGTDSPPNCEITIGFTPAMPTAPGSIHASAYATNPGGVPTWTWTVKLMGATIPVTQDPLDGSQIDFAAMTPGLYDVTASLGLSGACPDANVGLTVAAGNAKVANYRFRVWPPPALAPTQESVVQVFGGGNFGHDITLDPGIAITGQVTSGGTGVAAYLRFMPVAAPDAYASRRSPAPAARTARACSASRIKC